MRQEKPSARTTASGPAFRTAGSRSCSATCDRHLVVPLLDPEVAREATAAADPRDGGAGLREQRGIGLPADDGVVVAVRLGHDLDPGEVGRRPRPLADLVGQELRERPHSPTDLGDARVVDELAGVLADRRETARLQPDDRCPVGDVRVQGLDRLPDDAPGRRQLAGGDPGEAAARLVGDDRGPEAHRLEQLDRRPAGVGGEPVGERVGPDPHVGPCVIRIVASSAPSVDARSGCSEKRGRLRRWSTPAAALATRPTVLLRSIALASRGGVIRAQRGQLAERVVRARAQLAAVLLRERLGLVGRHVDAGRAVAGAALAGQAEVEGVADGRVVEAEGAVGDVLEHVRAATGRVLLLPGGEVRRTHHAARAGVVGDALADARCSDARRP